jgi:hypothetical protein
MRKHNERCKECKKRVFELLEMIYGKGNVFQNYNLQFPNQIDQLVENELNINLEEIFKILQDYREHKNFVRSKKLPNVDYYIKNYFILEFDESQHFTKPRLLALENYSNKLSVGFEKDKWIELCKQLDKKDNDPPFRDEQRAWYDTIRDFAPTYLNLKPTIRLFASDYAWCSLNTIKRGDVEIFQKILNQYKG